MNKDCFNDIATYYNDRVVAHGHCPQACDYGHENSQHIKFTVLSEALLPSSKTILDVGCGFADFANFLKQQHPMVEYTGYDISPEMVSHAQKLHPQDSIALRNILKNPPAEQFDMVTANGIFYLLGSQADSIMKQLIKVMFSACLQVTAFNSLSSWAPEQTPGEFYADPLKILAFCRELTPWVTLRHDYHPRDFTIYMYREQH